MLLIRKIFNLTKSIVKPIDGNNCKKSGRAIFVHMSLLKENPKGHNCFVYLHLSATNDPIVNEVICDGYGNIISSFFVLALYLSGMQAN